MQSEIFPPSRTVMRFASWLGNDVREERVLPYPPGDYEVEAGLADQRWTVTLIKTGEMVYNGIGPVELVADPDPSPSQTDRSCDF